MCGSSYQPITRSGPVPRFAAIADLGRTSSQVMYSMLTGTPVASWNFFEFAFQDSSSALTKPLQRKRRSCASFATGNIGAYFAAGPCANERVAAPAARPRPHFMNERRSVMSVPPMGAAILVPARSRCQSRRDSGLQGSPRIRGERGGFRFFEKLFLRVLRVSAVIIESFLAAVGAGKPGEAFVGGALRAVFEADRAGVAQLVEVGEEGGDGLFAGAGLVAAG